LHRIPDWHECRQGPTPSTIGSSRLTLEYQAQTPAFSSILDDIVRVGAPKNGQTSSSRGAACRTRLPELVYRVNKIASLDISQG
jgi:hypothetical protein